MPSARPLPTIDDALLEALTARGFAPLVADDADDAREMALGLLPDGALVAHGGSETLEQIGLVAALHSSDRLQYGNARWLAEGDPDRRLRARQQNSIFADAYLGSVQAVALTGQVVGADNGGSRQGPYVWGPRRVIWVAGANKIVPTLEQAIARVYEVALPLEDQRMRDLGDPDGSRVSKLVVYEREPREHRTTIILVRAHLGF